MRRLVALLRTPTLRYSKPTDCALGQLHQRTLCIDMGRKRKQDVTVEVTEQAERVAVETPRKRPKRGQPVELAEGPPSLPVIPVTPSRRSTRIAATSSVNLTVQSAVFGGSDSDLSDDPDDEGALEAETPPKRRRKGKKAIVDDDAEVAEDGETQTKKTPRKRKPKVQEPVVYDIPDVMRKETTFKGNYSC